MSKPADHPTPPVQPMLLDVPAAAFVATLDANGNYTAERLRQQRPDHYRLVVDLLSRGHGSQFIEDYFHQMDLRMSKNTVKAVRKAEGETIDLLKAKIAEKNFEFAEQADEAAALILDEIMSSQARRSVLTVKDVQALKAASASAITSGQLLTGKPTANVSVEVFSQPTEDLNAQIAAHIAGLKSAVTHLPAEKNGAADSESAANPAAATGATGADLARPLVLEIEAAASPLSAQDDRQSPVTTIQTTENQR